MKLFPSLCLVASITSIAVGQCPAWTTEAPATTPSTRYGASLVYDAARQECFLFGGYNGSYTNTAYAWAGTNWAARSGGTAPTARAFHSSGYDPVRQRVVIVGGMSSAALLGDVHEWNGTSWSVITPSTTTLPPRRGAAMAWDPINQTLVLFGGFDGFGMIPGDELDDMWSWDGSDWTQLNPTVKPGKHDYATMVTDTVRNRIVMTCGRFDTGNNNARETWEWDGFNWELVWVTPSNRNSVAGAFDPDRNVTLIVGGLHDDTTSQSDTWLWTGYKWQQTFGSAPSARHAAAMTYDQARNEFVLFGGRHVASPSTDTFLNSTLTLNWSSLPSITTQLVDDNLLPGDTLSLTVGVPSTTGLTFTWRFNGQPINLTGRASASTTSTTATLTITGMTASDEGAYDVIVTSSSCSTYSHTSHVTVRCPADFDGSGFVDLDDFNAFSEAFDNGC